MATTQAEIELLVTEIATQFKTDRGLRGDLSSLSTTAKNTLVAAINEINGKITSAGAQIDDTTPSTTKVYSSSKTNQAIADARAALKAEILGGASAAYDTLQELVTYFQGLDTANDADVAALVTAVAKRLRFDAVQSLTSAEKIQGNTNLGSVSIADFGDTTKSYRTTFLTALSA